MLKLKPPPAKAVELLKDAAYKVNVDLFHSILKEVKPDQLNDSPLVSCTALEQLVRRGRYRDYWSNTSSDQGDAENLQCVEMLLDAGAKWNPPAEELRYARRSVLEHDSRYIVQLLRLLLYTPNAASVPCFLELCRSQKMITKINETDRQLVEEIKTLRKTNRLINASGAEPNMETAADAPHKPS